MLVFEGRKRNLVPATADRETVSIEMAGLARLRKSDPWDRLPRHGTVALAHKMDEDVDRGASRRQRFRDRVSRRPTRVAIRRDPLRLVEGRRVEPRLLGKAGGGKASARGQPVDRISDLGMGQHAMADRDSVVAA
jgi:hypothetical protein